MHPRRLVLHGGFERDNSRLSLGHVDDEESSPDASAGADLDTTCDVPLLGRAVATPVPVTGLGHQLDLDRVEDLVRHTLEIRTLERLVEKAELSLEPLGPGDLLANELDRLGADIRPLLGNHLVQSYIQIRLHHVTTLESESE